MPPAHIFIVRHSERMDHIHPDFGKTYPRPHDSPITENGVALAESLGAYLVRHYHVDPSNTVILSSPLTRCVQTSHAIIQAALEAAGRDSTTDSIPIYVEPAIMEGPFWIFHDMKQNPNVVDPTTGTFTCPEPVYRDAVYHESHTSPHVKTTNPFPLHTPPAFAVEENTLVDETFPDRCHNGVKNLLTVPELRGKTVLLLAHGETVLRSMYALTNTTGPTVINGPAYTAFVHLTCEGSGDDARMVAESTTFATPHLPQVPKED